MLRTSWKMLLLLLLVSLLHFCDLFDAKFNSHNPSLKFVESEIKRAIARLNSSFDPQNSIPVFDDDDEEDDAEISRKLEAGDNSSNLLILVAIDEQQEATMILSNLLHCEAI